MPKLSIIVPIYNVEEYLANCIESILNQTFKDFELILVNDGSTDNSLEICYKYRDTDKRINVINKKNGGVSSARNIGIEISKGEYIAFVDPDDDIEISMYEELIGKIEEHDTDIIVCSLKYINLINNTTSIQRVWGNLDTKIGRGVIEKEIFKDILSFKEGYGIYTPVNKVYKRRVFDKYKIRFDEKRYHGEDARLNLLLLNEVESICFVDNPFYNYYIRNRESLTKVVRDDFYNYILDNKNFHEYLCTKYKYEELKYGGIKQYLNNSISYMIAISKSNFKFNKKINILNNIMNDKTFIENIKGYECPYRYYKLLKLAAINKASILYIFLIKLLSLKERLQFINQKI